MNLQFVFLFYQPPLSLASGEGTESRRSQARHFSAIGEKCSLAAKTAGKNRSPRKCLPIPRLRPAGQTAIIIGNSDEIMGELLS